MMESDSLDSEAPAIGTDELDLSAEVPEAGLTATHAPSRLPLWLASVAMAAVIGLFAYLCTAFGFVAVVPRWIAPALTGAVTAVAFRSSWVRVAIGTSVGVAVGVLLAPAWFLVPVGAGLDVPGAIVFVLESAAAAAVVALVLEASDHSRLAESVAAGAIVIAVVASMWATTVMVDAGAFSTPSESLNAGLATRPDFSQRVYDRDYYVRLFYDVHEGKSLYASTAAMWREDIDVRDLPAGVTSYRLPTLFWFWSALPDRGDVLPWAFLVFATLAVPSAFTLGWQVTRPGIAVLGALAVAVAYLHLSTSWYVTYVDGWGMAFTLAGVSSLVASMRTGSRRLLWLAIAAFLIGAAVRELLVYPLILAMVATLAFPGTRRWRDVWPWIAGLAVFALGYSAHVRAIAGRINPAIGYGYWLRGGLQHLVSVLRFFEGFFGASPFLVPMMVLLAVVGVVSIWREEPRISLFLGSMIVGPLLAFLFFGPGGPATEPTVPYWAILVIPTALAAVPLGVQYVLESVRRLARRVASSRVGVADAS